MTTIIEIIYNIRRILMQNDIKSEDVKITIEFTNAAARAQAEACLRQKVGLQADQRFIDDVVAGREVTVAGLKFVAKETPREQYLPACGCSSCEAMRVNAYAASLPKLAPLGS